MTPQFKSLLTRTISGAVFVALVVGSFFLPSYVQFGLFTLFAILAVYEYVTIVETTGVKAQKLMSVLITVLLIQGAYFLKSTEISWVMAYIFMNLVLVIELFRKEGQPFNNIVHTLLPLFWIAIPFTMAGVANVLLEHKESVLALFILIWCSDTFAYCGGSLFGKHKMFERISPKKTWEGFAIGGLFTCAAAAGLSFVPYFSEALLYQANTMTNVLVWIGFGLVVFVMGTLGDLIESMFKRSYGVKDSGNIMPGHGGMLDRFDSFLFAMPFCMIYWVVLSFIY
ncbi:MAG: phosphatidate cytidylyltransferase [Bacteroidales bacterium]|nr:phosphatidate cytidylyltransferase [Bacteroidales bacterium]